ncbi:MAG: hypothetical protein Q9166_000139 [cf. Caloplaca sp. 2 TL-2023]
MATEIATMPLQAGIDTDDPNSAAGKVLTDTFNTLRQQEDWDSVDAHKKFQSQPYYGPFGNHLMSIVDGQIESICHAHFTPHPPSVAVSGTNVPVTEMITHYFSADISESERSSFESGMKEFHQVLKKAEGFKGFAGGWVVEELEHKEVEGKTKSWQSCIGWQSVEAHMAFRETKDFKDNVHLIRSEFKKASTMHHTKFKEV